MALATLLVGQLCVGAAGLFGRLTVGGASGLLVCAWRMILAAAALMLWRGLWERGPRRAVWDDLRGTAGHLGLGGALLAIHFATWILSLRTLPVALSSLLVATSPLWHLVWQVARREHLPAPGHLASLMLSTMGTVVMLWPHSQTPTSLAGAALALAGGATQTAYLVVVERLHRRRQRRGRTPMRTSQLCSATYIVAACLLAVVASASDGGRRPPPTPTAWAGIVAMAFISQLMGHTAVNAALRVYSAGQVALTTLLKPVFAALLAAVVLGERLDTQAYVGGLMVLGGIAAALRMSIRPRPLPAAPAAPPSP